MVVPDDEILDLNSLREVAFASVSEAVASPLHRRPYLLLRPGAGCFVPDHPDLLAWLRIQPCPIIGIAGEDERSSFLDACDLVLHGTSDLKTILTNIRRAPMAAMTLVQVLRITESLPPAQALNVESLAYSTLQSGPEFSSWLREYRPVLISPGRVTGPPVLVERDGGQLNVVLNRPRNRNAMSVEMRDALFEVLQWVLIDASIRRIRFSAAGACFSVGGDLSEFGTLPDPASAHAVRSVRLPAALLIRCAGRAEFHLHGACIGAGAELPAFAGRVIAARNTFFQLPEIRFGLLPGAGGCVSLSRRIGRQRTAWLALSARRISAASALDWGLVDELVD